MATLNKRDTAGFPHAAAGRRLQRPAPMLFEGREATPSRAVLPPRLAGLVQGHFPAKSIVIHSWGSCPWIFLFASGHQRSKSCCHITDFCFQGLQIEINLENNRGRAKESESEAVPFLISGGCSYCGSANAPLLQRSVFFFLGLEKDHCRGRGADSAQKSPCGPPGKASSPRRRG